MNKQFELLGKTVYINEQGFFEVIFNDCTKIAFPRMEDALEVIEERLLNEGNV